MIIPVRLIYIASHITETGFGVMEFPGTSLSDLNLISEGGFGQGRKLGLSVPRLSGKIRLHSSLILTLGYFSRQHPLAVYLLCILRMSHGSSRLSAG
ncbi:hypothetical protein VFPPC_16536 [Pochonia chlamydosporia 170]|uniref:Uncharacterized protein n=1 Tax=Pochonia chlamydosporia 170 TaxID=1380566 RepID=A0A179F889_METCM|nr:hypothetical protein VFPPC_16536 [Pochonia chlamydosporia 170]OAQ61638.1 hypothetical protein VFPPC_16536 [Pochonia chlamydosporia 170]